MIFIGLMFVALVDVTSKVPGGASYALGAVGLVGAVATLLLFGTDFVHSVIRPVGRVTAGARRLERGDFAARVEPSGAAEIQRLAESLNRMARALEGTHKELERQRTELGSLRVEATSASRAKTDFLSRMSHELRTPLNAILGFAQLLEMDDLDARQRDNVAHIVSGGRHLLDLINEVLEISRIETGSMSPVIEPVHVVTAVREVLELVAPLAAQRNITLTADLTAHEDLWIEADQQRLKQVLLNLVANGVKYNRDEGSVRVEVALTGTVARIRVVDTGMGIAQDQLPKLFVPFERLGAESTGVEGTGLGLVLCLRLTEAMNGKLGVESQPWIGSTFWMELPVATPPEPEVAEPEALPQAAVAGATQSDAEKKHRVLYIEDDAANTRLMARLFSDDPRLELTTTMQGTLGLELARRHVPDLILLDVHLPDLEGPEIIRRLRNDEVTQGIPVIAVSADATDEARTRMTALGAARYLTKPLTLNAVLAVVWDVIEDAEAERSAAGKEATP